MKKFIVTSVIPSVDINTRFHNSLKNMSRFIGADIIYIKTHESAKEKKGYDLLDDLNASFLATTIDEEIYNTERDEIEKKYVINDAYHTMRAKTVKKDFRLNHNLLIKNIGVNINSVDPILGLDSISAMSGSLIIGAPRHRFKTIPRSLKHTTTPSAIWCTGTISKPSYKATRSGIRMSQFHQYGALLVTVESDKIFHVRQLQSNADGSFYDMRYKFNPDGSVDTTQSVDGYVLGDIHPPFHDMEVMNTRLKLMSQLNPKNVFYHDSLDCCTISHHTQSKTITKAQIAHEYGSLLDEVFDSVSLHSMYERHLPTSNHVSVMSNHNEHLIRWLEDARYVNDPVNHVIGLELALELANRRCVYRYLWNLFSNDSKMIFLKRGDTFACAGNEMSNHGDAGNNGAKGNATGHGLLFNGMCVTGHEHSPSIGIYGNFVVGTSTTLTMPYTNDSGGSGWLHSDVIVYPSGTKTHIHFIKG